VESLDEQIAAQMGWSPDGLTPALPMQLLAQSPTECGNSGSGQQGAFDAHEPAFELSRRQVAQRLDMPATRTWQTGSH
jgi:hypothetical protein